MKFSQTEIKNISEEKGFDGLIVEKVLYLLHLLNMLNAHPFLKDKFVLKGGTALNLFIFDIPRLSVDIDLNYIGALDREEMMRQRPEIEKAMLAVFNREEFKVRLIPVQHAGGKWRLQYKSFNGSLQSLEVDINFMLRQPLWDIAVSDSRKLGQFQAVNIPLVDKRELYSGKLAAFFSRNQARDLYDVHLIVNHLQEINTQDLRIAFVVYGAMNLKDWRTVSFDEIAFELNDVKQKLIPVLKNGSMISKDSVLQYAQKMVEHCKNMLSVLLPLNKNEIKFLDLIFEKGEIDPSLLTEDKELYQRIKCHPMLAWRVITHQKNINPDKI